MQTLQKAKGHTQLTTIATAAVTTSSTQQDATNTQYQCTKCGYNHLPANFPAYRKRCYNCGDITTQEFHFTSTWLLIPTLASTDMFFMDQARIMNFTLHLAYIL